MPTESSSLVPNQEPMKLAGDLQFTEGPLWHPDGHLLFSDIPADTIRKYTPGGGVETYLTPSRNSNGLTFDRQVSKNTSAWSSRGG